ncbi:hypothetical protein Tco_0633155 [Tanacetum coccineum]
MPMSTDLKLTLDKDGVSVDSSKYRCNLTMKTPRISYMDAIFKDIFRYIKASIFRPLFPNAHGIEVCVYVGSDHAGDYVDRKSTIRVCTLVGGCLTQWCCKKQMALAISTNEA